MKTPRNKLQTPKNLQISSSKSAVSLSHLGFGAWNFSGAWCLGFGVSSPRAIWRLCAFAFSWCRIQRRDAEARRGRENLPRTQWVGLVANAQLERAGSGVLTYGPWIAEPVGRSA